VSAPANTTAQQSQQTYAVNYIVQPGDTLGIISRKYGVSAASIIAANNLIDANHIEVGQALVVPGVSSAGTGTTIVPQSPSALATPVNGMQPTSIPPTAVPVTAVPAATTAPIAAPVTLASTYTVRAGEDLAAIARKFGLSWTDIASFNNIADPNLIYAGMVLKIPSGSVTIAANTTTAAASSDSPPGPLSVDPLASKQIVVVLHEERFYAYENGVLVRDVLVSTGLPMTPTVTGTFHIYVKYPAQLMVGPDYYLPNVPWVSYFYEGYALHGTYWHHNWGHEMSHGCVNMPTDEAKWVYDWAPVGTTVTVMW
jgi:LysM repeat protein